MLRKLTRSNGLWNTILSTELKFGDGGRRNGEDVQVNWEYASYTQIRKISWVVSSYVGDIKYWLVYKIPKVPYQKRNLEH